ncbi:MAG: SDR family NAD(P)-dependent oxidoreductase [Bacteroidota bacterium]
MNEKIAVVTGGLGALGLEVSRRFLSEGARVAIPVRAGAVPVVLPELLRSHQERLFLAHADLTSEGDVRAFITSVNVRFGQVDILINAAGGYAGGESVGEVSLETLDHMLSLNLKTAFLMCSVLIPSMRERRFGRIISMAAMPALLPSADRAAYAIAKRGVVTLTETIAVEVKGSGITANAIAPSIIRTESNAASMPNADASRWVPPGDIAALMLFLCSEEAGSISGNTIRVFGGV